MTRLKKILTVIGLIAITGTLYGCYDYFIPHTWNYRLTIEIETPEGVKASSVVRQVQAKRNIPIGDSGSILYRTIGEALVIDLGNRGVLFSLNRSRSNSIYYAFPKKGGSPDEKISYYVNLKEGEKVEKTAGESFVWLENLNSNKPLQRLKSDNFHEVLGEDYKYKRTIIEITDAPVTWEITPLLEKLNGKWGKFSRQQFHYK